MSLKNKHRKETIYTFPFCFLLFEFVFGMYLNDVFTSVLSFADEVLQIILFLWTMKYAFFSKKQPFNKETCIFAIIAIFYLVYSFYIRSNVGIAILSDFLIQLKPFVAFYMIGYIGFTLTNQQKWVLKKICLLLFFITAIVGILSLTSGSLRILYYTFEHATRYGTALVLIGLTYLFCSDLRNKKDILIFILILSFSLISLRAKIFGFYGVAVFLILFLRGNIEIKISLKNIIIATCIIAIAGYLALDKLYYYFIDFSVDNEHSLARPMLFLAASEILLDYFPFGSGLASFATHYSGVYYSSIYGEYNLDIIWGLLEGEASFITDTQYPSIAQFGVVGFILFSIFWTRIVIKANKLKRATNDNNSFLIIILILIFLAIESVGDAVFTGNRGFYCMTLLALALNTLREKQSSIESQDAHL